MVIRQKQARVKNLKTNKARQAPGSDVGKHISFPFVILTSA